MGKKLRVDIENKLQGTFENEIEKTKHKSLTERELSEN